MGLKLYVGVLITASCITNYPKTEQFKTIDIYYLIVSVGQESMPLGQGLYQAAINMPPRVVVTSRLDSERICFQTHSHG